MREADAFFMRCFGNAFFVKGEIFMDKEYEEAMEEFYKKLEKSIENHMNAIAFADNFVKQYYEKYEDERPDTEENKL